VLGGRSLGAAHRQGHDEINRRAKRRASLPLHRQPLGHDCRWKRRDPLGPRTDDSAAPITADQPTAKLESCRWCLQHFGPLIQMTPTRGCHPETGVSKRRAAHNGLPSRPARRGSNVEFIANHANPFLSRPQPTRIPSRNGIMPAPGTRAPTHVRGRRVHLLQGFPRSAEWGAMPTDAGNRQSTRPSAFQRTGQESAKGAENAFGHLHRRNACH